MMIAWLVVLFAGLIALIVAQRHLKPYLWTDLRLGLKLIKIGLRMECFKRFGGVFTLLDKFLYQARVQPNKPFIIFEGDVYTYRDVDIRSNKIARVFLKHEVLKKGDTVAMLMSNEPDFVCVWLGLLKLGCSVAFLNSNIRSKSLLHCFNSCSSKLLVVGADMLGPLEDIFPSLQEDNINIWVMGKSCSLPNVNYLSHHLEAASDDPIPTSFYAVKDLKSVAMYIFTSGTTGLPKAAVISELQAIKGCIGLWAFGATKDDIVYTTLPLYHSAASLIGVGGCIELGATCVLKKKFSASQFWNDCRKYNITIFQYIGELCRYLCNQPKVEGEKNHKVRLAVGNGIRSDIWKEFIDRFGDIKMCELYGATEGNISFINYTGQIGAVGRANILHKMIFPFELIKYDIQKDEPIRNAKGWCEPVKKGETGLLISQVNNKNPFFGYAGSKKLTERKLLCNVFKEGDVYFNTGDLMMQDQYDFLYFRDRIGDTFRWKGENVATTEVADTIGALDSVKEVTVYGVIVPGHEGRTGMAAVILKPDHRLDEKKLYEHVVANLPGYACPRFVRILKAIEITGTFKQQKFKLVEEGFNPSVISDPLYYFDAAQKSYVPMTNEMYDRILNNHLKL
ncbi:long-chain fatty acid transport protein 6-like [Protopterus annectens]|uniref:long-chain fatty acid transport protein 6-like n=1 Tax=Protopterus annectens TaxID=7888 RepID=UPI001CFA8383|nr:long-chain fatty acid transport protein 6-like [Protopterus annectens]